MQVESIDKYLKHACAHLAAGHDITLSPVILAPHIILNGQYSILPAYSLLCVPMFEGYSHRLPEEVCPQEVLRGHILHQLERCWHGDIFAWYGTEAPDCFLT